MKIKNYSKMLLASNLSHKFFNLTLNSIDTLNNFITY